MRREELQPMNFFKGSEIEEIGNEGIKKKNMNEDSDGRRSSSKEEGLQYSYNPTFSFNPANVDKEYLAIEIKNTKIDESDSTSLSYEVLNNKKDGKVLKDAINVLNNHDGAIVHDVSKRASFDPINNFYSNSSHSIEEPVKKRKRDSFDMLRRNSFLEKHPYLKTKGADVDHSMKIKDTSTTDDDEKLNIKLKDLLIEWHSFCDDQSALHGLSSSHYRLFGNTISVLAILLATVGGTSNLATMDKHDATTSIIFGVLSLSSGALMSIHRTLNYPELQRAHNFHSDQYAKIKNEIEMQLNIHQCMNKTYSNLVEFCKSIKTQIDSLIDRSPFIQNYIVRNYFKEKEEHKKDHSVMYSSILLMNKRRPEIKKCST